MSSTQTRLQATTMNPTITITNTNAQTLTYSLLPLSQQTQTPSAIPTSGDGTTKKSTRQAAHAVPPSTVKKPQAQSGAYEVWINGDTKGARRMIKIERRFVTTYRAVRRVMPRILAP